MPRMIIDLFGSVSKLLRKSGEDLVDIDTTWLRTVEKDLQPFNLCLASVTRLVQNCSLWHVLVEEEATLTTSPGR